MFSMKAIVLLMNSRSCELSFLLTAGPGGCGFTADVFGVGGIGGARFGALPLSPEPRCVLLYNQQRSTTLTSADAVTAGRQTRGRTHFPGFLPYPAA